jgi:hypothetical protein
VLPQKLLIAESELNRAQLSEDWRTITCGVCGLAHQAKTMAVWGSSAAVLVAGIKALRRDAPAPGTAKSSWVHKLLSGARIAWTIWLAFRTRAERKDGALGPG